MRGKRARALRRVSKYKVKNGRKRKLVAFDTKVRYALPTGKLNEKGEEIVNLYARNVLMHNDASRAIYRETKRRWKRGEFNE